jgi:hypothetical protein
MNEPLSAATPEPSALMLLGVALVVLALKKRWHHPPNRASTASQTASPAALVGTGFPGVALIIRNGHRMGLLRGMILKLNALAERSSGLHSV